MSTWLCSDTHLSVIADAAVRYLPRNRVLNYIVGTNPDKPIVQAIGEKLLVANAASVAERYSTPHNMDVPFCYKATPKVSVVYSLAELLVAVESFRYQSSETREWKSSNTCHFTEALVVAIKDRLCNCGETEDSLQTLREEAMKKTWQIKDE